LNPVYSAANVDGHSLSNLREDVFLYVKNGGASPITVTVITPGAVDGLAIADLPVTVTNAQERMIGPFPKELYNQPDNTVHVNFSDVTSVTVAAIQLGGAGV